MPVIEVWDNFNFDQVPPVQGRQKAAIDQPWEFVFLLPFYSGENLSKIAA